MPTLGGSAHHNPTAEALTFNYPHASSTHPSGQIHYDILCKYTGFFSGSDGSAEGAGFIVERDVATWIGGSGIASVSKTRREITMPRARNAKPFVLRYHIKNGP